MEAMMAPVPWKGTATNSIRPSHWNSSTRPSFSLALTNSMSRNRVEALLFPARKHANLFKYDKGHRNHVPTDT
ncbi:hypothetical protein Pyn_21354 [Prunus yedoensis var. nudiflora]|uniref:Uncharacterized protein n=1 Tax=Prunus yedoensis var. nudiflora TaxID=2094558 RepID=A0A314YUF9_PRUYE|nr:hypothetical protein Pyn_21354 [Prunus yedoensis var. nudiflora]